MFVIKSPVWIAAGAFCILPSAFAAQLSPDQELIRQQERERAQQEKLQPPAPDVRLPRAPVSLSRYPESESPCFTIKQVQLVGEESARFQWALSAVNDVSGRCLGTQGINAVMNRVLNAIIQRGYVTTRVLASPQDLKSGTLVLTLVPGRIHAIRFSGGVSSRATWYNAIAAKPGDILNLRDIEQGLENFKRVPTADADIQIEPGAEPGESDLVISWKQATPIRLSLSVDDSGSKSTGKYQGTATVSLDNLLTLNDLFYASAGKNLFQNAPFGTHNQAFGYSLPFGYWLLGFNYSHYTYYQRVAGINQSYVYSGDSDNSQISLSRLIYRDANNKTTVSLQGYQRKSRNFIDDTEVQIQHRQTAGWELGLGQHSYLGANTLDANLSWRHGTGAQGALPAPEEASGEGDSRASIALADISLSAPFDLLGQHWRYNGMLRTQWTRSALTPQDRFSIGGRYTVRGFDGEQSLTGEHGWLVRNDMAWLVGGGGHELYLGLDYGRVDGPSTAYLLGHELIGGVVGLRGTLAKQLSYDLFIGQPLKQPDGFQTATTTAGFSCNWQF